MKKNDVSFYERIKNARKVLYLDLGFLGDTIHQIPALRCIREALPDAEIHAMVGAHIVSIMEVVPWVNRVIGYPRFPKGPVWYRDISRVMDLRKEKYDVIINLNGSDRSSLLTWAIGAPLRLGRIPPKIPAFWRFCFTHTISVPRGKLASYRQSWECLKGVGFPGIKPEFNITIPKAALERIDQLIGDEKDIIHISPFTSQDSKELPLSLLIEFINKIQSDYPNIKIAFSCAPNHRETSRLEILLRELKVKPWKVLGGQALPPVDLAAFLSRSVLHIGGNSGALHVAFMAGASTMSWHHDHPNIAEWLPDGPNHHAISLSKVNLESLCELFKKSYQPEFDKMKMNNNLVTDEKPAEVYCFSH